MIILKHLCYVFLLLSTISYGASTNKDAAVKSANQNNSVDSTLTTSAENIDLINAVYKNFVFVTDSEIDDNAAPEAYFTDNALRKLQEDYEFDCDEGLCYAYYALRTTAQDSNPESDGISQIMDIKQAADGWYIVSYSDMGWIGKTCISIIDGKIDDYERIEL